jgi:mono/diheme cytochrome c family protein
MKAIYYTHLVSVIIFLVLYLVKTILLVMDKQEPLAKMTRVTKVPEMIISVLFLVTGIYMLTQIPEIKSFMIIKVIAVFASIPLAVIGFKKKKKILAILAVILLIAAYGLAEMSKKQGSSKQKSKGTETSATAEIGHDIFVANCVACHGEDGKLQLMGSPDLSVSSQPLETRIEIIRNGKGVMNGFAGILNEEQIRAVAEYSETLKK